MPPIFEVKKEISEEMGMDSHIGKLTGNATAGAPLYRRFCIGCHPSLGDGEGENAMWIDPKPRNPSFMDNLKPDDAWNLVCYLRTLQPMHTKAKDIAKQLGLKPITPNAPAAQPQSK